MICRSQPSFIPVESAQMISLLPRASGILVSAITSRLFEDIDI